MWFWIWSWRLESLWIWKIVKTNSAFFETIDFPNKTFKNNFVRKINGFKIDSTMSTLTQCAPVAPWSNRPERKSQQTCELLTNLELQQCQSGTALASRKPLRWVIIYTHFSGTLCEAKSIDETLWCNSQLWGWVSGRDRAVFYSQMYFVCWNMMCNSAKRVFVCACKGTWQAHHYWTSYWSTFVGTLRFSASTRSSPIYRQARSQDWNLRNQEDPLRRH